MMKKILKERSVYIAYKFYMCTFASLNVVLYTYLYIHKIKPHTITIVITITSVIFLFYYYN